MGVTWSSFLFINEISKLNFKEVKTDVLGPSHEFTVSQAWTVYAYPPASKTSDTCGLGNALLGSRSFH